MRKKTAPRKKTPRKKTTRRPPPRRPRKKGPAPRTAKAKLREKIAGAKKASSRSPLVNWFATHVEARDFLELWFEMKAAGETGRDFDTIRQVYDELVETYGLPCRSPHYFYSWLDKNYRGPYRRAMGRITK